jgi:uncharacterized protein YbjQ (UPF0145 family)
MIAAAHNAMGLDQIIDLIVGLCVPVVLIGIGLTVGRLVERRHLKRIAIRRAALSHMLISDLRTFPGHTDSAVPEPVPQLIMAEAVIAADYLKSFLAALRKIIGGELRSYQSLMYRAREEALLRVMEKAQSLGYDAVCNVRLETADIAGAAVHGGRKQKAAFCSVICSATAYRRAPAVATG